MGVLIDASILIAHERSALDVAARVRGREDEAVFLSVVTVSELLHGVHRAERGARRARRSMFVAGVIDRLPLLPVDLPTARVHAEVWADLAAKGRVISAHDLWLAAACLAHGLTLATANVREFSGVPGLEVEDWTAGTDSPETEAPS